MSHRYRLYPTPAKAEGCRRHCDDARFVWNLALEQANCWRPGRRSGPGPAERQRQLSEARQGTWLAEGSSSVQQQALRDFDRAMKSFFEKPAHFGFPTWRKAGLHEGFCVRDVTVKRFNRKWASIVVPKVGPVRFRLSRPLPSEVGMARVTMDRAGRWHVSFTSAPAQKHRLPTGAVIGIDRGVTTTFATSDGQMLRIATSPKLEAKATRLRRQLACQQKGSGRRARTKAQLSRTTARITDRRRDWVEKISTRLVTDYDVVVLEDLKVKGMLKTPKPKPDPEKPGNFLANRARAKAGLNRSISRSCWSLFLRRLRDKAAVAGVEVILVDPGPNLSAVPQVRPQRSREPQEPSGLLLRRVWPHQPCGHQRCGEHLGPGGSPHAGPGTPGTRAASVGRSRPEREPLGWWPDAAAQESPVFGPGEDVNQRRCR